MGVEMRCSGGNAMREPLAPSAGESARPQPPMPPPGPASALDDEHWLAAARPRLRRLARLRGVAAGAVEDVVQETLFEAWKHRDRKSTRLNSSHVEISY